MTRTVDTEFWLHGFPVPRRTAGLPASRDAAPELVVESNGRFTGHVLPRLRR